MDEEAGGDTGWRTRRQHDDDMRRMQAGLRKHRVEDAAMAKIGHTITPSLEFMGQVASQDMDGGLPDGGQSLAAQHLLAQADPALPLHHATCSPI